MDLSNYFSRMYHKNVSQTPMSDLEISSENQNNSGKFDDFAREMVGKSRSEIFAEGKKDLEQKHLL